MTPLYDRSPTPSSARQALWAAAARAVPAGGGVEATTADAAVDDVAAAAAGQGEEEGADDDDDGAADHATAEEGTDEEDGGSDEADGCCAPTMVFVLGFPRSGTTTPAARRRALVPLSSVAVTDDERPTSDAALVGRRGHDERSSRGSSYQTTRRSTARGLPSLPRGVWQ